jgi:hypothetical protein
MEAKEKTGFNQMLWLLITFGALILGVIIYMIWQWLV